MLWLAVHLPRLPLEALPVPLGTLPLQIDRCVVDQGVVLVADEGAQELGLRPGLSQATAAALAPQVMQCPRNPPLEADFVRHLALALGVLTPHMVVEPGGVLLEIWSSLRLFGGLRPLLRRAREIARSCGALPVLGLAPTAQAAQLLARCPGRRRRALRTATSHRLLARLKLPAVLYVLGQPPRLAELLHAIGSRTVGDVRALPRAGLHRRGAAALLQALDHAFGDAPDPRRWFEPPAEFAAELDLMYRADDAQMLGHAAERLLHMLAGWLSRQWLAATRLRLVLRHESGRHGVPDTELVIELGQPSRDAKHLMVVLGERLQRLALAAPAYGLRLVLDEARPCAGHEGSLLPDDTHRAENFHALIDRLCARLGRERVQRLELHPDHRPQRAYVARCAAQRPPVRPASAVSVPAPQPSAGGLLRPAWLLALPVPLDECDGGLLHGTQPLRLLTRTERIESGWFDGALVCRDYRVAEGSDHRLRWVYRERRATAAGGTGWYLHGLFG
jgi:protein ImuB